MLLGHSNTGCPVYYLHKSIIQQEKGLFFDRGGGGKKGKRGKVRFPNVKQFCDLRIYKSF